MKPDDFEQRLQRQPLRQIPAGWRVEIAGQASRLSPFEKPNKFEPGKMPVLLSFCRDLLWPHPKAWAGLAAVWILILALNFSTRNPAPAAAQKSAPASPEVMAELKQQQRMLAELIGARDAGDADRSKPVAPLPRSERAERVMT